MTALDYPILGAPTISPQAFAGVLSAAGSPMAPEAMGVYDAFVAQGVNPAIGLAIAQHESSFGTLGIAVGRNNPYGLRYYGQGTNAGGWSAFPSYTAAAQAEASLLAGPLYGGSSEYNTARTFPARYAPSSDGNDPAGYGATVANAVASWSGGGGGIPWAPATSPGASAGAAAPAAPAGLAGRVSAHPKAAAASVGIGGAFLLALIL